MQVLKLKKKKLSTEQQEALKDVNLTDVCNFYMGTLAYVTDSLTNRKVLANTIIIDTDAKLPVSVTKRYTTIVEGQEQLECSVTQSEGPEEKGPYRPEDKKPANSEGAKGPLHSIC